MTLLSIERGVNWQANNSFTSKGCKSATIGVSQLHFCRDLWLVWTSLNLHGRERQYSDGQSCLISVILLIIFGPLILPVNCSLLLTNTCFLPFFLFSLSLSFSSVWPDWVIILPIWATLERPKSNNFLAIFENGANLSIFKWKPALSIFGQLFLLGFRQFFTQTFWSLCFSSKRNLLW